MRISDWSSDVCSSDLKLEANHDPDLAVNAMHEILRWQTPLAHMRRTAMEDTELFGHQIRKRDKLALWYASANRDESVFPDGDRIIVDRENARRHLDRKSTRLNSSH